MTKKKSNKKAQKVEVSVVDDEQARTTFMKQVFLEVFLKKGCSISASYKEAGIESRTTYYVWLKKDKDFAAAIKERQEALIDYVEALMLGRIKVGSDRLIEFFLERRAKTRGYGEKSDIAVDINITHTYVKPKEIEK